MVHFTCDTCGDAMIGPEVTTLAVRGPLRSMANRANFHVCKLCAYELAGLFNVPLARPEHLAEDMPARRRSENPGPEAVPVPE